MEKLERTLSDVQSDLSKPPETSEPSKKVKKVAKDTKKSAKKVVKKGNGDAKPTAKKDDSDMVTLADLASEAKITGASARRRLRDADMSPEGRWKWKDGSKELKEARKVLGLEG